MSFSALGLPEPINRGVRAAGYSTPTPIHVGNLPDAVGG